MSCNSALILAAGKGNRLKPITNVIPKPLIQVGRHRLIEYHLFNLSKAGIKQVYINRAHLRQKFDELLDFNNYPELKIIYLDEPDTALETAGAIINAFDKVNTDRLIVVNGDIWTDFNYNNIKDLPRNINDNAHVILTTNPDHNPAGDFCINGNRLIVRNDYSQTYTFTGIGIYRREMFETESIEFKKLAPMLMQQIELNRVSASFSKNMWMDIGTVRRLETLRLMLNQTS